MIEFQQKGGKMKKKQAYREMTLLEFQDRFSNEKKCLDYLIASRWPHGFECPSCSHKKGCFKPSRKVFECYKCKRTISPTSGTVFHRSRVPLRKWFWFIYLMATSKKGVSTLYLQKHVGIGTYATAWLMTHKIRKAMKSRNEHYKLEGLVEADEIWIGGKQTFKERREKGNNKTPFFVAVSENTTGGPRFLSFEQVESIYEEHILPTVKETIEPGSTLKTDGSAAYNKVVETGYGHQVCIEMKTPDQAHEHLKWVNMITSNLKRYLLSTHHGVFPKFRKAYLAEFAYRFNRRFWPHQAFDRLLFANIFEGFTPLRALT